DTMPLDEAVLALMRAAAAAGRPVYLASAAARPLVDRLARRLEDLIGRPIDGVFATDGEINLAGTRKREALLAAFGAGGFDYVGNAPVDVPIWEAARQGYVVREGGADPARRFQATGRRPLVIVAEHRVGLRTVRKAARVHQWAKNLLIFVPMVLGGALELGIFLETLACFLAFGLIASATYIANDLVDLPSDRRDPSKR